MEFGAFEAQKAAVAAHPRVAVPRLQDGVCLVGRQAVGLVEYRSHIGRLQLHRPRRDTAQHRRSNSKPCHAAPARGLGDRLRYRGTDARVERRGDDIVLAELVADKTRQRFRRRANETRGDVRIVQC